jgi:S-formylglutathione hydrolase FrmB
MKHAAFASVVLLSAAIGGTPLLSQGPAPQTSAAPATAAEEPVVLKGSLQRIKVKGKALEGNLLGESDSPEVSIYLPPSYERERGRRYPVVYLLHGYTGTDLGYFGPGGRRLHAIADRLFDSRAVPEMILVMPNCMNVFGGCMYASSVTTGDWETYIAEDLVSYMDRNYRTIPTRDARGLAGHSMGGFGTIRIAMKRPDVFSSIYALSSCCLNEGTVRPGRGGGPSPAEQVKSLDEVRGTRGGAQGTLARAAAWAPNPQNPPLYLDLPTRNGEVVPEVAAKWAANSPVAMLDQYVFNLRKLKAIALDIGLQDGLIASNRVFVERLERYRVAHTFETYEGDHGNRIPQRLEEKVLPFFGRHLSFTQAR